MKNTIWKIIESHARQAAADGRGPDACRWKYRNFKTYWMKAYANAKQLDFLGDNHGR